MYDYAVKRAKAGGNLDFTMWLDLSKVSENQKVLIKAMIKDNQDSWIKFWKAFDLILNTKHKVLTQLHKEHGKDMYSNLGIRSSIGGAEGGEGYMSSKGKIVNPLFRSAADNPRFTGEIA